MLLVCKLNFTYSCIFKTQFPKAEVKFTALRGYRAGKRELGDTFKLKRLNLITFSLSFANKTSQTELLLFVILIVVEQFLET